MHVEIFISIVADSRLMDVERFVLQRGTIAICSNNGTNFFWSGEGTPLKHPAAALTHKKHRGNVQSALRVTLFWHLGEDVA